MISDEQMERAAKEFSANASACVEVARDAQHALENYEYRRGAYEPRDPKHRDKLFKDFEDADYMAESRAWILGLIRADRTRPPQGRIATITVNSPGELSETRRIELAAWLREQADYITSGVHDERAAGAAVCSLRFPNE